MIVTLLDDAPWGDFPAPTVTRDPAAAIRELKEQSGKDIWLWGSLKLMHSLMDASVVDEEIATTTDQAGGAAPQGVEGGAAWPES